MVNFHPEFIYTKHMNGWLTLNTILTKVSNNEELSDNQAISLLILPDMDIDIDRDVLMMLICILINKANIPDKNFKNEIILCAMKVLVRFIKDKEDLLRYYNVLVYDYGDPVTREIVERYGPGFNLIYFEGREDEKFEIAKKLLINGVDEVIISKSSDLSLDQIKKLKREL